MEFLGEYGNDCLLYIDREYDIPEVKEMVNSMIISEMRTFTPGNYLLHLPNPELKFEKSEGLRIELARCANGTPFQKMDNKRYNADKPDGAMESDVQAWRNAVANIKAQLQHQENRLMNLELAEEYVGEVWLKHNSALEQIYRNYSSNTESTAKRLRELSKGRQIAQEKAYPDLVKLQHRRDKAIVQKLQCQAAYQQIDDYLTQNGFNYNEYAAQQELLRARDLLSAEHNDTVRAYETVNESMDVEEESGGSKRQKL